MGENLALNIVDKGFSAAVYNRTAERTRKFAKRLTEDTPITPTYSIAEFLGALETPRKILLMVTAGRPIDEMIEQLAPGLSKGDLLVDGGNSLFRDTEARAKELQKKGLLYLGIGISGGEEGALRGPSIMAGGSRAGYELVEPILTKIAAQVGDGPCCSYLGPDGAGHFTKMVHNGIEYAVMQLIAEVYDVQRTGLGLDLEEIGKLFADWNGAELNSYLMEVTIEVLGKVDADTGKPLVDVILDRAAQKGTGKWTSQSAFDLGVPIPSIDAAVSARNLSAYKKQRVRISQLLGPPGRTPQMTKEETIKSLRGSLYSSVLVSYAQGFTLLKAASDEYDYSVPLDEVARIWKGGCIIRAKLLDQIQQALKQELDQANLLGDGGFSEELKAREESWRHTLQTVRSMGIPCPVMNASLDYFDAYRRWTLPAGLIQGMRDYFGSHGYERVDKEGSFHTNWNEE